MKSRFVLVSTFLIFLCVPTLAKADEVKSSNNVSLFYGEMTLSSDWKPVEKQPIYGVIADYNPGNWPVNLMGGFSASDKSAASSMNIPNHGNAYATAEVKTTELSLGARKYLMDGGGFRPYVSAGISSIWLDGSVTGTGISSSGNDSSIGYFGNGGIMILIDRFSVGIDFKILAGTSIKIWGGSFDANYNRWAVTFGMAL